MWPWPLLAALAVAGLYLAAVVALVLAGRRTDARALAGFVPDCIALFRRLLADRSLPPRTRLLLGAATLYLASPIDLVPDFVPVAGQLDDAVVVAMTLRLLLRSGGEAALDRHWPGPERSRRIVRRLAFGGRR